MMERKTSTRALTTAIAAVVIGIAIALFLVEGLTRLFFDEAVQPRYVIDPGYGVRANQVNVRTRHYVPGDYDVAISTNSAGMRGQREYPRERVPGKRRILMLGDSFTFGYGVEDSEVVSAVLEDMLNAGGPAYEVLNLGVSGFGQAEELVTWEHRGREYQPDVVVLFYFDNDIANNVVSRLYEIQGGEMVVRTGMSFLPGSSLQEALFNFAPTRWLFENSEAWNLIRHRLSSLVQGALLEGQGMASSDDVTPEGVALTRALLSRFVSDIRAAGAQPVLVVSPSRNMRSNFPLSREEVAAMGVPLVDGRDFLGPDDFYRRDAHWRASGHRKVAELLEPLVRSAP